MRATAFGTVPSALTATVTTLARAVVLTTAATTLSTLSALLGTGIASGTSTTFNRNVLPDQLFNVGQQSGLFGGAHGKCGPFGPGACRTADPMDVAFRLNRHFKIDHMGHTDNIDAAGRDVRGDEHPNPTVAELLQRTLARTLGLVAVDRIGANAASFEPFGDLVGPMLGAGEDDHPGQVLVIEQAAEQIKLLARFGEMDALANDLDRDFFRRDVDPNRVVENLFRQFGNFPRHGGREKLRLTLAWQFGDDLTNIADKTHIEHAVGLI